MGSLPVILCARERVRNILGRCNLHGKLVSMVFVFSCVNILLVLEFALPKPLHYTRGTSIICALAIESADENVLELLGNTRAPFVRLTRHVEDAGSGLESRIAKVWDAIKHPSTFVSSATWHVLGAGNDVSQEAQAAIRALRTSLSGSTRSKIIIGRICLAPDLTPSFSFAKMSLKVCRNCSPQTCCRY